MFPSSIELTIPLSARYVLTSEVQRSALPDTPLEEDQTNKPRTEQLIQTQMG